MYVSSSSSFLCASVAELFTHWIPSSFCAFYQVHPVSWQKAVQGVGFGSSQKRNPSWFFELFPYMLYEIFVFPQYISTLGGSLDISSSNLKFYA